MNCELSHLKAGSTIKHRNIDHTTIDHTTINVFTYELSNSIKKNMHNNK
jgi:hypothetical protein